MRGRTVNYNDDDIVYENPDGYKSAYQVGVKFKTSAAWKVLRCRADDNNIERKEKLNQAISLLLSGQHSIREVSNITGYAQNTTRLLFKKLSAIREKGGGSEVLCPCGCPLIIHRGWCSFRFAKSKKRQEFLRNINNKERLKYIKIGKWIAPCQ